MAKIKNQIGYNPIDENDQLRRPPRDAACVADYLAAAEEEDPNNNLFARELAELIMSPEQFFAPRVGVAPGTTAYGQNFDVASKLPPVACRIADAIAKDLNNRCGLGFDNVDPETRDSILRHWAVLVERELAK